MPNRREYYFVYMAKTGEAPFSVGAAAIVSPPITSRWDILAISESIREENIAAGILPADVTQVVITWFVDLGTAPQDEEDQWEVPA